MFINLLTLIKRDDNDCDKNSNSQYCQTGSTTSTLTICLAVIIPVVVVGVGLGVISYIAYKRNRKEAMEDENDPDFTGETYIPDDPHKDYYFGSGDSFADASKNPFETRSALGGGRSPNSKVQMDAGKQ